MDAVGKLDLGVVDTAAEQLHLACPDGVEHVQVAVVQTFHTVHTHLHRVKILAVSAFAIPMQLIVGDVLFHRLPLAEGVDDVVRQRVDRHGVCIHLDVLDHVFFASEVHHSHGFGARRDIAGGHILLCCRHRAAQHQGCYYQCFFHPFLSIDYPV